MTRVPTTTDRSVARKVLQTEAAAILALVDRLDESFDRAVRMLYECQGRVLVTGMGKSGIICRKMAATLASTGTSAFFLHPAEATHGDLGVIQPSDLLLAISHSGETQEVKDLGTGAPDFAVGDSATASIGDRTNGDRTFPFLREHI